MGLVAKENRLKKDKWKQRGWNAERALMKLIRNLKLDPNFNDLVNLANRGRFLLKR